MHPAFCTPSALSSLRLSSSLSSSSFLSTARRSCLLKCHPQSSSSSLSVCTFRRRAPGHDSSSATTTMRLTPPSPSSSSSISPLSSSLATTLKVSLFAAAAFMLTSIPTPLQPTANALTMNAIPKTSESAPLNGAPLRLSRPQQLDEYTSEHSALRARWDVHSLDSRTETLVVLSNKSESVIDLWWIDYTGTEVYYASINPGTTHMQPSFASHPWVVREHLSQNSVLMLVATPNPIMAVVKSV